MFRQSQCCPVHHMLHVSMMLVCIDYMLFWGRTNAMSERADAKTWILCFLLFVCLLKNGNQTQAKKFDCISMLRKL